MTFGFWKGVSLRSWIMVGMAVAVLPLAGSAAFGYFMLHRGVLGAFQDVATRQRQELNPLQKLRLTLVEATSPVDAFIDDGDPAMPGAYREVRTRIEAQFAALDSRLRATEKSTTMLDRARSDWTDADRIAGEALSVRRSPGDAADLVLMGRFHGLIDGAVDKLGVEHDALETVIHHDHDVAIADASRAERFALAAGIASVLAIMVALFIVGKVIAASVERLVNGAELFAAGDRDHRIDVQLPPELHRVAEEFNRMIGRIHESENSLVDLARRDSLTHLQNRRAFDETLSELLARHARLGERWALLMLDLDHFKAINDTHGHAVGDDVLRAVARTLADMLRPFDKAFRVGGEEFAIVLGATDRLNAEHVAERIRKAIEGVVVTAGAVRVPVTASIGMALVEAASTAASMTNAADAALYAAKEGGRNRVEVA